MKLVRSALDPASGWGRRGLNLTRRQVLRWAVWNNRKNPAGVGEIGALVDGPEGSSDSLQKLLLRQLDALGEQALQLEQPQRTVRELLARLSGQGHAEPTYFMTVLERMTGAGGRR